MSLTASDLIAKYQSTINETISSIKQEKEAAIPGIIATISTEIVPNMMVDVGKLTALDASEKRDLIVEAITSGIAEAFKELNEIPELAAASWDETIRDHVLTLIPGLMKLLLKVEGNQITFNKKSLSCCC